MDGNLEKLVSAVEKNRELLLAAEKYLWQNPEVGFKEWKTSAYLEGEFGKLGYEVKKAGDIPGFIAELDTGKPGPNVAVIGELDSVICATHPEADGETHAVHACGHHCQATMALGCAVAFKQAGVLENMCGTIRFILVPAEEGIDLDYRSGLLEKGTIKYVEGKIEFLRRGFFDDVDMAMMIHVGTGEETLFQVIDGAIGCILKHFEYRGVAAHAGVAPHEGVNALYAASLGMTACNALRETFREKDYIRFHPIVTQAGVATNTIPQTAKMDAYVRAGSVAAMIAANRKINRALTASAAAIGANLFLHDMPGNLPYHPDGTMLTIFKDAVGELFGEGEVRSLGMDMGSTDLGDISNLMPAIQTMCGGATGRGHGEDYIIADKEKAVINPTKALAATIYKLLSRNGEGAKKVIENFTPVYADKETYFKAVDAMEIDKSTVDYHEDGTVTLNFDN